MNFGETGWCGMDWIDLAQKRNKLRGLSWMRLGTFGFHKFLGSSRGAAEPVACQVVLSPIVLVS
jgi:hypothetical protein